MEAGERPLWNNKFHLVDNVYIESCGDATANICFRGKMSVETIMFHLMVNVYMETAVIQQLTLVSVTKCLEGLPLPATKPTHSYLAMDAGPARLRPRLRRRAGPAPAFAFMRSRSYFHPCRRTQSWLV